MNVNLAVPDELLLALKTEEADLAGEIRMAAAVKLYELGRLSSGAASQLAGVPKPLFLSRLADYGVDSFDLTEEELRQDLLNA
jgi:predicted HTH domain antitoxin